MQNSEVADDRPEARYAIDSVTNAARILLMLRDSRELQVGPVAAELGVARSTAHRLLTTLQAQGLLAQRQARGAYMPGPALVEIGASVVGALDLSALARPALERIADETGETTHLLVLRGRDILFVDGVEGRHIIRAATRIGDRGVAHASAAGKVLLALLTPDELRRRFPDSRLSGGTENALKTRGALERELEITRERGYALNHSESEPDLTAIAVAVIDASGHALGAVSISGPAARMEPRLAGYASLLKSLTASLGI